MSFPTEFVFYFRHWKTRFFGGYTVTLLTGYRVVPGNPLYRVLVGEGVTGNPLYWVPGGVPSNPSYQVPGIVFYLVPGITVQFIPGTTR